MLMNIRKFKISIRASKSFFFENAWAVFLATCQAMALFVAIKHTQVSKNASVP